MWRKLAFASIATAMLSGCALTAYPVITDEDQVKQANGTHIVNTAGDAFVAQEIQIASIVGDKTFDAVWFANQDQRGDQTLWTRWNIGNTANPDTYFYGQIFMNNNFNTCWVAKAENPVGDTNPFDFQFNQNCYGENLVVLVSSARTQEAGRDGNNGNNVAPGNGLRSQSMFGVSVHDALNALGQLDAYGTYGDYTAQYGLVGWKMVTNASNIQLALANGAGVKTQLVFDGVTLVFDLVNQLMVLDTRGSNTAAVLRQVADWVDANGQRATLSATFAGLTRTQQIGLFDGAHYRALADQIK